MFEQSGDKIMSLAKVVSWVIIIFFVVLFFVFISMGDAFVLYGIIFLIFGIPLGYVVGLLVYGFGQLISDTANIKSTLYYNKKTLSNINDKLKNRYLDENE